VIRVTHEVYGWTDKLFRVNSVAEEKDAEGNLFAVMQAFEYNDTVYADDPVQDFVPAFNTGLLDPNVIDAPGAPVASNNPPNDGQVKSFNVSSSVSDNGLVLYMDFNYGNSSNVQDHVLYRTLQQSNGDPFTNSDSGNAIYNNVSININDLPAGNYYFSTTARNNKSGKRSNSSPIFNWAGANLNANTVPANTIIGAANIIILDANSNIGLANAINFIGTNVVANLSNNQTNVYISPSLIPGNSSRGFNFYGQASTGNYTFTDLTGSNVRDEPCYLYGTSVDANNYYPWYQNTSVTTAGSNGNNYYSSNSTAPWTPAAAADIIISDGDDNWYAISTTDFDPTDRLSANNRLITNIGMSVVSNVNATMQYAIGFKSNAATDFTVQTQVMGTFDLIANKPIQMNETFTTGGAGLPAISSTALFVRNITPNSNVIFYGCLLQAFNTFPL